ncbi:hypothetical protein PAXRUDRAFT_822157 [Paxillus rubicundulus Ve08.2h10]|uniref:Uncharacterized protein n=1 Tax=Paxillus rubicundulus Ve08.2h10 TaxID=930991 RepID=A0A0D0E5L8_9AGAM|nr:hypothetical protein PAXRUDRAFT_822157 [Paxillus rubicundulus Ve08.2h10]
MLFSFSDASDLLKRDDNVVDGFSPSEVRRKLTPAKGMFECLLDILSSHIAVALVLFGDEKLPTLQHRALLPHLLVLCLKSQCIKGSAGEPVQL